MVWFILEAPTSKKMPSTAKPSGAAAASPNVRWRTAFQCTRCSCRKGKMGVKLERQRERDWLWIFFFNRKFVFTPQTRRSSHWQCVQSHHSLFLPSGSETVWAGTHFQVDLLGSLSWEKWFSEWSDSMSWMSKVVWATECYMCKILLYTMSEKANSLKPYFI